MLWNIVCDSSCDLTSAVLVPEKLLLTVVPMTITVENEHYRDDEALDPLAMLAHMNAAKGPSCTSCPSVEAFASAFRKADPDIRDADLIVSFRPFRLLRLRLCRFLTF